MDWPNISGTEKIIELSLRSFTTSTKVTYRFAYVPYGAEDGSRVACSGKTLQFFVCFICFFVVLRVRCC